jgi:hypothetical protein
MGCCEPRHSSEVSTRRFALWFVTFGEPQPAGPAPARVPDSPGVDCYRLDTRERRPDAASPLVRGRST